ncbi:MAG: adenosine deaminase [Actinomycetota bacterium]
MPDRPPLTREDVRTLPTVLLHDHLDGGVRPRTLIELAVASGYDDLPATDPDHLAAWMTRGASRHDLVLYLETFAHTVAVMQDADALSRVARECTEDLAADGVVYAEVRFAPELHTQSGMALDAVVDAVVHGFRDAASSGIRVGTLVTAMRTGDRSLEIAELAVRWAGSGVIGFDLAGAEAGFPPEHHRAAFDLVLADGRLGLTIHAGEAAGLASIEGALACRAQRLGHGVHIADDLVVASDGEVTVGPVAGAVRARGVPLELCPTSNVHSGAASSIAEHPIGILADLGFRVTVNTDNRLMSATTQSREFAALSGAFGWDLDRIEQVTVDTAMSAFLPEEERRALVDETIRPGFERARADS